MGKITGICRLCNLEKLFIKAHVIPKGLFRAIMKEYDNVQLVQTDDLEEHNRVQDAFYDSHILCGECDQIFSPYEQYFASFVKGEKLGVDYHVAQSLKWDGGYLDIYDGLDTNKIRIFFLIMLWRISISNQPDFQRISLKEHEEWMKAQIITGIVSDYDTIPVEIISFQDVDDVRKYGVSAPKWTIKGTTSVLKMLINCYLIVYSIGRPKETFCVFNEPNGPGMQVVRVNQEVGVKLLNDITGIPINIPQSLLDEVKAQAGQQ